MKKAPATIMQDGVEYATIEELARRFDAKTTTIRQFLTRNNTPKTFVGNVIYVDADMFSNAYNRRRQPVKVKTPDAPKVDKATAPAVTDERLNPYAVDPKILADCTDKDGEIDYSRAVTKLKALVYQQQLDTESGKLVYKTDVDETLEYIFVPLKQAILRIPERYSGRIATFCEDVIGRKLSSIELTAMKAVLEDEAALTLENFIAVVNENLNGTPKKPKVKETTGKRGRPSKSATNKIINRNVRTKKQGK